MKKLLWTLLCGILFGTLLMTTGCEQEKTTPTKTGGGGLKQIYDTETGRFTK